MHILQPAALRSASVSGDCESTHFPLGLLCEWRPSMLTKSQYRWPTRVTMDADRKLVSQPSVDSENNERVTSERVGSCFLVFDVYRPNTANSE